MKSSYPTYILYVPDTVRRTISVVIFPYLNNGLAKRADKLVQKGYVQEYIVAIMFGAGGYLYTV